MDLPGVQDYLRQLKFDQNLSLKHRTRKGTSSQSGALNLRSKGGPLVTSLYLLVASERVSQLTCKNCGLNRTLWDSDVFLKHRTEPRSKLDLRSRSFSSTGKYPDDFAFMKTICKSLLFVHILPGSGLRSIPEKEES